MRSRSGSDDLRAVEILLVRPDAQRRAGIARAAALATFFSFSRTAPFSKTMRCTRAFALHLDFEPLGERVGDRHADAVQAAGELVRRVGFGPGELRAGVQLGEDELHGGDLLFRMQPDRNAAAVVGDRHRAVAVQRDVDAVGVPAERLVGGVVDRFLDDVGGIARPGIHPRQALHGLDAAQFLDRAFVVFLCCHARGLYRSLMFSV